MIEYLVGAICFLLAFAFVVYAIRGCFIWLFSTFLATPESKQARQREIAFDQLKQLYQEHKLPGEIFQNLARVLRGGTVSEQEWRATLGATAQETTGESKTMPLTPPPTTSHTSTGQSSAGETSTGLASFGTPDLAEVVLAELVPVATPEAASPNSVVHPLDRPDVAPPPRPTPPWKQLLQAFMEERNIRWGEIVSGLLIVVCAVGLVVSLWSTLRESIPYMPALVFMLGTAAFHAAGLYTLRKWQLRSVSRAVLVIAVLLIPLNFLAAAALSGDEARITASSPVYWLAIVLGIAAYGTMAYVAGRALVPRDWPKLICVVMGPSIGQLLINRLAFEGHGTWRTVFLGLLPLLGIVVGMTWQVTTIGFRRRLTPRATFATLLLLGVSAFAFLSAIALLLLKTKAIHATLAELSPLLSVAAGVVVVTGLTLRERAPQRMGAVRVTGDSLAVFGAFLLMLTVYLAWPRPALLIAVGALNAVLLGTLAFRSSLHLLLAPATLCAALAALIAARVWRGELSLELASSTRELVNTLVAGITGIDLTVLAGVAAAVAFGLGRRQRGEHARVLFAGAAALSVAGLLVTVKVGFFGGAGRDLAAPILAFYAILVLAVSTRVPRPAIGGVGSLLLLGAIVQSLMFNGTLHQYLAGHELHIRIPFALSFLLHGNIVAVLAALAGRLSGWNHRDRMAEAPWRGFVLPLGLSALVTSACALPAVLWVRDGAFGLHTGYAISAATIWFIVGLLFASREFFTVFEALVAIAASLAATYASQKYGIWRGEWLEWQHLMCQMAAVAITCLNFTSTRQALRQTTAGRKLFDRPWPFVDQVLMTFVVVGLLLFACWSCQNGVLREVGVRSDEASPGGVSSLAWWTLWLALAGMLLSTWERANEFRFANLLFLGMVLPLFLAAGFESQVAVATAIRWGLSIYCLAVAAIVSSRDLLLPAAYRDRWPGINQMTFNHWRSLRLLGWMFTAIPVVVLTAASAILVGQGYRPNGPAAATWFARIGPTWAFATPLVIVAVTFLLYALRERQAWYMLAGSAVFQYIVTLGFLMPILEAGRSVTAVDGLTCWHLNALGLGIFSASWLWANRRLTSASVPLGQVAQNRMLLNLQLVVMSVAALVLPYWTGFAFLVDPDNTDQKIHAIGTWPAYLAILLAAGVIYFAKCRRVSDESHNTQGSDTRWSDTRGLGATVFTATLGLTGLVAASVNRWNNATHWHSYHVMLSGGMLVALGAAAWNRLAETKRIRLEVDATTVTSAGRRWWTEGSRHARGWGLLIGALLLVYAIPGATRDAAKPLWSLGTCVAIIASYAAIAWSSRIQFYAYLTLLTAIAGAVFLSLGRPGTPMIWLFWTRSMIAAALCGLGWLAVDIGCQRRLAAPLFVSQRVPVIQRFVAVLGTALLFAGMFAVTVSGFAAKSLSGWASGPHGLIAAAVYGVLLFGLLWDSHSRWAIAGIYIWGMVVEAIVVDVCRFNVPRGILSIGYLFGGHIALTGALWTRSPKIASWGASRGIENPIAGVKLTAKWLPVANNMESIPAAVIACGVATFAVDRSLRVLAGFIPVLIAYGAATLAQKPRREWQQRLSLLWLALAAVLVGWADMEPQSGGVELLQRGIRLLMILSAVAFGYQVVVPRWLSADNDWRLPLRRAAMIAASAGLVTLLAVMGLEATVFLTGGTRTVPINDAQLIAVSVVMVGLIVALLAAALAAGRDPFDLSEKGRMIYVYGAQAGAALLFAHVYLCRSHWFSGWIGPYWPYVILAIAFGGIGASELFRRHRLTVLAEPMERTGAFLPLLPALGMWMIASESNYSLLLFLAGILYLVLSFTQKSFVAGIAAAMMGNASLWQLLVDRRLDPLHQPQIWMVPPALSVLVAAELNRKRLDAATLTAIRYITSITIYLSSTGELFIRGVGESIWPPMILLVLSLSGAFLGIVLRVRAFLYLGTIFLFLALTSMVWHASRAIQHVWPWWAFGIALGLGILMLFGIFEKRREDVRKLAADLKQWD